MKHIYQRDFINYINLIVETLKIAYDDHINNSMIQAIFSYIIEAREKLEIEVFIDNIKSQKKFYDYEDNFMSYAEELRREGFIKGEQHAKANFVSYAEELRREGLHKGLQEGIREGMHELIINMFNNGMSADEISRCTNLSLTAVKKLLKN